MPHTKLQRQQSTELLLDLCEDGNPYTQQFLKAGVGCGDLLEALDSGMSSVSLLVTHALQLLTGRGDVVVEIGHVIAVLALSVLAAVPVGNALGLPGSRASSCAMNWWI